MVFNTCITCVVQFIISLLICMYVWQDTQDAATTTIANTAILYERILSILGITEFVDVRIAFVAANIIVYFACACFVLPGVRNTMLYDGLLVCACGYILIYVSMPFNIIICSIVCIARLLFFVYYVITHERPSTHTVYISNTVETYDCDRCCVDEIRVVSPYVPDVSVMRYDNMCKVIATLLIGVALFAFVSRCRTSYVIYILCLCVFVVYFMHYVNYMLTKSKSLRAKDLEASLRACAVTLLYTLVDVLFMYNMQFIVSFLHPCDIRRVLNDESAYLVMQPIPENNTMHTQLRCDMNTAFIPVIVTVAHTTRSIKNINSTCDGYTKFVWGRPYYNYATDVPNMLPCIVATLCLFVLCKWAHYNIAKNMRALGAVLRNKGYDIRDFADNDTLDMFEAECGAAIAEDVVFRALLVVVLHIQYVVKNKLCFGAFVVCVLHTAYTVYNTLIKSCKKCACTKNGALSKAVALANCVFHDVLAACLMLKETTSANDGICITSGIVTCIHGVLCLLLLIYYLYIVARTSCCRRAMEQPLMHAHSMDNDVMDNEGARDLREHIYTIVFCAFNHIPSMFVALFNISLTWLIAATLS